MGTVFVYAALEEKPDSTVEVEVRDDEALIDKKSTQDEEKK